MSNWIPAATATYHSEVLHSRFIASAGPTASVEQARAFIAHARAAMPAASHHVYAYSIGHGATTTLGMSDDGEPSGTAGRPLLSVVKGSGLGDLTLVVTRYFGGTLLGTGGLVHAYGDAAREVLAILPRVEKIERRTLLMAVEYASYEQAKRLILAHAGAIAVEEFAADVTIEAAVPLAQVASLTAGLTELTAGRASIVEA
ncbi:MAG: YigZ family protein [Roseiflexaceae bacterium]|nr:YigZ family protein [Roseiflexaceae bacterium]